jgi:hypothetical protein
MQLRAARAQAIADTFDAFLPVTASFDPSLGADPLAHRHAMTAAAAAAERSDTQ